MSAILDESVSEQQALHHVAICVSMDHAVMQLVTLSSEKIGQHGMSNSPGVPLPGQACRSRMSYVTSLHGVSVRTQMDAD